MASSRVPAVQRRRPSRWPSGCAIAGSGSYLVTEAKQAGSAPPAPHGTTVTLAREYPEDFVTCEGFLR
jgi:hypothetical protein